MTPPQTPRRQHLIGLALTTAALACTALWSPAHAQGTYPVKPIKLVVGFPPGGSNDIVARIVAPALGQILGQQVVVENRPGASGTTGAAQVAQAPADGYTLMLSSASPLVIAPHMLAKMPFDVNRDFAAINTVGLTPEAIAVNPSLPVKNFRELIELAKKQDLTVSSSGNGGLPHLTIELLKQTTKARIVHVPYKGAGPAVSDTIAGHVNAVTMDLPALISFIRDGRLKALALTSDNRVDFLPDVPTAQEQGLPSFSAVNWLGVFAPAATPAPVVDKLHAALKQVVADPQVREQLQRAAVVPHTSATPQAFQSFLAKENDRWGRIARESGARMD